MKLLPIQMISKRGTVIVLFSKQERELVRKWYEMKGCIVHNTIPDFSIKIFYKRK